LLYVLIFATLGFRYALTRLQVGVSLLPVDSF